MCIKVMDKDQARSDSSEGGPAPGISFYQWAGIASVSFAAH